MPATPEIHIASDLQADPIKADLSGRLAKLRAAYEAEPYPTAAVRKDRLRRGIDLLIRNDKRIVEAVQADYGGRPEVTCILADVLAPVRGFRHALRRVERWMRIEKHKTEFPMGLIGGRAYVFYQPLGVVGIVAPWNAPFGLAYLPLAAALAAGNRAMIKPSELTPNTSALIAELTARAFGEDEVCVVEGALAVSARFSELPFDHLLFTGGTRTARSIMRAAAENLVPVTLELGGKSPTIVAQGADLDYAASKIVAVKLTNAGQICMTPDFVLVHRDDQDAFVEAVERAYERFCPPSRGRQDQTRVHLQSQRRRLSGMVKDAEQRGATLKLVSAAAAKQLDHADPFPIVAVVDPPLDSAIMSEEIFGPLLPIVPYDTLEGAVQMLRKQSHPLALYFIGGDAKQRDYLLKNTHAGGVSFDDVMLHPFMQDLPFGGVGESGMGRYSGFAGFKTLSNGKSVAHRPWIDVTKYLAPPFTPAMSKLMRWALRL